MDDSEHQALVDKIADATSDFDYIDDSDIRRARDYGLYVHAAQCFVDATGNSKVSSLLKRLDPDYTIRREESETFSDREESKLIAAEEERPTWGPGNCLHCHRAHLHTKAAHEQAIVAANAADGLKTVTLSFRVPASFDTPSEVLRRARDLLLEGVQLLTYREVSDLDHEIIDALLTES